MKKSLFVISIVLGLLITVIGCSVEETKSITVFCGSASKPAMEEAAQAFEEETGTTVFLNFSGSGTMLAQMKVSESGDLYIPGSPDYMAMAINDGVVEPDTVVILSYLVPAVLVQAGNPLDIRELSDLAAPGIDVGIGNPQAVCVGLYAVEILEYNDLLEQIKPNIVTHAESCSKTAALVALESVDAIIGWRVFSEWHDTIDVVYLEPQQVPRLSYIPGAISTYAEDEESAREFLEFLTSDRGQDIFKKHGYLATEAEAREFAPYAVIGGEYRLPDDY